MSHDPTDIALAVACFAAAALILVGLAWWLLDGWLDRQLARDWWFDAADQGPSDTPIHDAALRAIQQRAAVVAVDDSWLRGGS